MKKAKYNGMYPVCTTRNPKLQRSKPEWSMDGYDSADEAVIEDDEGIKLCLKQARTEEASTPRYGNHYYW
jgi:hypothetical protein